MHALLTFRPTDSYCDTYNPRAAAQRALLAEIASATTLADVARIAQLDGTLYKPRWTGAPCDPYWQMGWQVDSVHGQLVQAAQNYMLARAYADQLPRLRSPERRARVLQVVENCASTVARRAYMLPPAHREALAAEVRALLG